MIKVGIVGATGYTALELIKILLRHPRAEITAITSRQPEQPWIHEIHHQLHGRLNLKLQTLNIQTIADECDCLFSCLPHGASAEIIAELESTSLKIIDFSADYRLSDVQEYESWYGVTHPQPERLAAVPYGLPEWFADQIKESTLVANPGCYPTSAILAIAPLLTSAVGSHEHIVIDSKSGVSGAGRTPKMTTLFPECNESIAAYGVGQHRHSPEIRDLLRRISGTDVSLVFTPHLVPMDRGILTTAYVPRIGSRTVDDAMDALHAAYADCPFVRVVDHLPATKDAAYSNFCDITVRLVGDTFVVISAIDNLIKGASGAAVQNMNLLYGMDETTGLL